MPDPTGSKPPARSTPPGEDGTPPSWRVDPAPDGRGAPSGKQRPGLPRGPRWLTFIAVLLAVNLAISYATGSPEERTRVPYQPFFVEQLEAGNVAAISSREDSITGELERPASYDPPREETEPVQVERFRTEVPTFVERDELTRLLEEQKVIVNASPPDDGRNPILTLILGFAPAILLIAFFVWLYRRQMGAGAGGPLGQFGRSRARRVNVEEKARVSFEDVAGIDEAENELVEIVDFLKNPDKYRRLGARIPRGVLLAGPPGTGKTLLARAVAGEADVPFFSISASEFVEAIVGVGASRVRDLFKEAKEAAPAIIFIDELDAIGRSRTSGAGGFSGGNDEREQTLNQILTEMDGFEGDEGVIVMGATNRPEILDQALLRPGRFDRRIFVQTPDRNGRAEILRIHTRSVPLDSEVDLDAIAASTPGMTGADLALLVNEAALFAARRGRDRVHLSDFTDAIEKTVLGAERQIVMSHADRERTAYHEAGHALVGMLTEGADPVRKVSIIPRGRALGVTLSTPDADRYGYEREELLGRIKVMLGGRVAERVVYDQQTTGAESDLQQLTQLARGMVARWGMSDRIGPVAVAASGGDGFLLPGADTPSDETQRIVDEEVRRIIDEAEEQTLALLHGERERLERLARALLERETLDQVEVYEIAGVPPPTPVEQDRADRRPTPEPEARPAALEGAGHLLTRPRSLPPMVVAIDGPAGAGKSTVARAAARALGFRFLDTGAMYRAVAVAAGDPARVGVDGEGRVTVDGRVAGDDVLRAPDVGEAASRVAADPAVRAALVPLQQRAMADGDWVAEGRDIATVVAPAAEVKVFLTADPAERARRRAAQTGEDEGEVLAALAARDERDSGHGRTTTAAAPGAVELDTTGLTIDEVVARIVALVAR